MVTKKGGGGPGDPGGDKPGKPTKAMLHGYKVFHVSEGKYKSAIETRKELTVEYGISADAAANTGGSVDTKIEFKPKDPKHRLLVFDSIKNGSAFQKTLSYETELWLCEVKDPVPMTYLLALPNSVECTTFWDKVMTGTAHCLYKRLPKPIKLFLAPPGTISVKTIRLIERVTA